MYFGRDQRYIFPPCLRILCSSLCRRQGSFMDHEVMPKLVSLWFGYKHTYMYAAKDVEPCSPSANALLVAEPRLVIIDWFVTHAVVSCGGSQ